MKEEETILSRPAWAKADGTRKYDHLIPPIVPGETTGKDSKGKAVYNFLRTNFQIAHFDSNYAVNFERRLAPPL